MTRDYDAFLRAKALKSPSASVPHGDTHPALFAYQAAIVRWALAKGRAALFCGTGSGKTFMQLEWARHVALTGGRVLLLAPLAVAHQTVAEADRFGISAVYAKTPADAGDCPIVVTNYERLAAFLPWSGVGVVLDESSILKAYDGKTRMLIIDAFKDTPYRLACTATPAPNDYMELGNHAQFLGVMTREEMLSMFFTHDGGDTSKWRLKGHAEREYWRWVCGWALLMRRPSDIGFSDAGFELPPLRFHEHVVRSTSSEEAHKRGLLFDLEARTLSERRDARRASLDARVKLAADIVASKPGVPWLVWCGLNAEGDALEAAIPNSAQVAGADEAEDKIERMLAFARGELRCLVSKSSIFGFGVNLQACADMVFVGLSDSFEEMFQSVRRCWRYGQKNEVTVHVVIGEAEGAVLRNIQRKESDFEKMADEMVKNMIGFQDVRATVRDTSDYKAKAAKVPAWLGGAR